MIITAYVVTSGFLVIVDWAMTRVIIVITGCCETSISANAITGLVELLDSGAVAILVVWVVVRLGNGRRDSDCWNGFLNHRNGSVTMTAAIVAIGGYMLSVSIRTGALMTSITI